MNLQELLAQADWQKEDGLLPAIVQNMYTKSVLMLGYMNEESLKKTFETGKVWFWSRSKGRLWMKGETSGNVLEFQEVSLDCDQDTFLLSVIPHGPTCHTGTNSCFGEDESAEVGFLNFLLKLLQDRKKNLPENSYTSQLFREGLDRIAQKVGEEAVEVVIAAKNNDQELFAGECADLIFHLMMLVTEKGVSLQDILTILQKRHQS